MSFSVLLPLFSQELGAGRVGWDMVRHWRTWRCKLRVHRLWTCGVGCDAIWRLHYRHMTRFCSQFCTAVLTKGWAPANVLLDQVLSRCADGPFKSIRVLEPSIPCVAKDSSDPKAMLRLGRGA